MERLYGFTFSCSYFLIIFNLLNGDQRSLYTWNTNSIYSYCTGVNECNKFEQQTKPTQLMACPLGYDISTGFGFTPFIHKNNVSSIVIDLRVDIQECKKLFPPIKQCRELFDLYIYESSADITIGETVSDSLPNGNSIENFTKIERIAVTGFEEHSSEAANTKTLAYTFKVGAATGFHIGFAAPQSCVTIYYINISYHSCSVVKKGFANFPGALSMWNRQVSVYGECIDNAILVDNTTPLLLCTSNGTYAKSTRHVFCKCKLGFSAQDGNCVACPEQTYKDSFGPNSCKKCPNNSFSTRGASICTCSMGFYRERGAPANVGCGQSPSGVRNFTAQVFDNIVHLSWNPPSFSSNRSVSYKISCLECDGSPVYFNDGHSRTKIIQGNEYMKTNQTSVYIFRLLPYAYYEFTITAENSLSVYDEDEDILSTSIRTNNLVKITNPSLDSKNASSILKWDFEDYNISRQFRVRVYEKDKIAKAFTISSASLDFKKHNLTHPVKLKIAVITFGQNEDFVDYDETSSLDNPKKEDSMDSIGILAGVIASIFMTILIFSALFMCFYKRTMAHLNSCKKKRFQYEYGTALTARDLYNDTCKLDYQHLNDFVQKISEEIEVRCLKVDRVIGSGEFGDVCKGTYQTDGSTKVVAMKTLKSELCEKSKHDFLSEASIMGQFHDDNVIQLIGIVTKASPMMIITEYMENGSLDKYLRDHRNLAANQLVAMMRGIASGMLYLAEKNYIHRDLAARNILLNKNLVCKVADFGLSRHLKEDENDNADYTTRGGKIPIRWTAPEALAYRVFSTSSDVWSFGIVCWEIMSYGERPYWNWANKDVINATECGYRLPPPHKCPHNIYYLILDCWQSDRQQRPTFKNLKNTLTSVMRIPSTLEKYADPGLCNPLDPNTKDMTEFKSVNEWLHFLKMERYTSHFEEAGYHLISDLLSITFTRLGEIGVKMVGHQKRLINSVQTLKLQINRESDYPISSNFQFISTDMTVHQPCDSSA